MHVPSRPVRGRARGRSLCGLFLSFVLTPAGVVRPSSVTQRDTEVTERTTNVTEACFWASERRGDKWFFLDVWMESPDSPNRNYTLRSAAQTLHKPLAELGHPHPLRDDRKMTASTSFTFDIIAAHINST